MRVVSSFLGGFRPWLIAVVVWLAVGSTLYARNPRMSPFVMLGLLLTFLIATAGIIRVLWPMRTYGNPPQMVAAAKRYDLGTYTGRVASASKFASTTFQAESSVSQDVLTGDVHHQLSTTQRTTIQDDVTLHGADGTQQNVQVRGANLSIGPGQLVSTALAIRPGRSSGTYVLFRNHTTGQNFYPRARLWWFATGRGAVGYLICMWLGGLALGLGGFVDMGSVWFLLMPFVYIGLGYYRARRFAGGSRALVNFLDGVAATFDSSRASGLPAGAPASAPGYGSQPQVPPPPRPLYSAPAWGADPTGRHEHRFWDGNVWTDRVADSGVAGTDPM